MCFRRPRRSKASWGEDEDLLAPRPVSTSRTEYYHNARILESHLEQQREISAVLEALDIQNKDYETLANAIDLSIYTVNGPPVVALLQPQPYKNSPPSKPSSTTPSPPSILLNGDSPTNIPLLGSSNQRDAWTLSRLTGSSLPSPQPTKYDILPSRPRPSDAPDLRYENYEIWDKVQKKNFEIGGTDLEWKTGVVDMKVEAELLQDYINWARDCRADLRSEGTLIKQGQIYGAKPGSEGYKTHKVVNRRDRAFMGGLEYELGKEIKAVARETNEWDERWEKEEEDKGVVWDIVERLEREEVERRRRRRERDARIGP